jgi:hypothetical protein
LVNTQAVSVSPEFIHLRIFGSLVLRPTRRSSLTAVSYLL